MHSLGLRRGDACNALPCKGAVMLRFVSKYGSGRRRQDRTLEGFPCQRHSIAVTTEMRANSVEGSLGINAVFTGQHAGRQCQSGTAGRLRIAWHMRFCDCELAQSYARVSTITGQADVFKSRSNFLTRSACFVNHCIDLKRKTSVVPGLGLEVGGKLPRSRRHRHAIDRIVRNRCCRSQSAFQHFTVGQRKLLPAMRCFPQCRNREPGLFLGSSRKSVERGLDF